MLVGVLGRPAFVSGDSVQALSGDRLGGLLAVLAAHAGRPVRSDFLADEVWEGRRISASTLRVAVNRLRQQWTIGSEVGELVGSSPGGYTLMARSDADEFADLVGLGLAESDRREYRHAIARLDAALALWRGPAFDGFAHLHSVTPLARRLDELHATACETRCQVLLELGDHYGAMLEAGSLVEQYPTRERATALHMVALAHLHRPAEAIAAYQRLALTLRQDLAVAPSASIERLKFAIERGDIDSIHREWRPRASQRWRFEQRALPASPVHSDRLIGRTHEIDLLRSTAQRSRTGLRVVELEGEPGIGKSSILREFAPAGSHDDWLVFTGRCERTNSIPFHALFDAFGDAIAHPWGSDGDRFPATVDDIDIHRHHLLTTFVDAVRRSACEATTVLVIDDAQWLDPSSSAVLDQIIADPLETRALLVLACRPPADEPGWLSGLRQTAIERGIFERVSVEPLDADDIGEIIGGDGDRARVVRAASGGNPLYAIQLGAHLVSGHRFDTPLPVGVAQLCSTRLDELAPSRRELIEAAAVIGHSFTVCDLCDALGVDRFDIGGHVIALCRLGLLTPTAEFDRYAFAHGVIEQVAFAALEPGRKAHLHAAIARVLERSPGTNPLVVAYHLAESRPIASDRAIAEAALRAGDAARRLADANLASQWYAIAVELTSPRTARRAAANFGLGLTRAAAGRDSEADTSFDVAIDDARSQGRWDIVADCVIAHGRQGVVPSIPLALAETELIDSTLTRLDAHEAERRARLLCRKAEMLMNIDAAATEAALTEADALIAEHGFAQTRKSAGLARLRQLEAAAADPRHCHEAAIRLLDELRSGEKRSAAVARLEARIGLAVQSARLRSGDVAEARRDIPRLVRLAGLAVDSSLEFQHRAVGVGIALAADPLDQAEELSENLASQADSVLRKTAGATRLMHLMAIRREQGRLHELERFIRDGLRGSPRRFLRPFLAESHREVADAAALEEQLQLLTREVGEMSCDWTYLATLAVGAESAAATGFEPLVDGLRAGLSSVVPQTVVACSTVLVLGHVDRYLGLLDQLEGDHDRAIERFQSARTHDSHGRLTLWIAWSEHDEAASRLRRGRPGDRAAAVSLLESSSAVAHSHGYVRLQHAIAAQTQSEAISRGAARHLR